MASIRSKAHRPASWALAGACLLLGVSASQAEVVQLSGKATWGQRAICDRPQGRKLVFARNAGSTEAAVGQDGYYSVKLEPGRYRVTLRCGGTPIKTIEVIGYPTPTQQDLAF
jgi:hypothetical protein